MNKAVYLTTTLPYVNADPHMGHALEFVQADILARYYKLRGHEVFFNTGTDEHGQKIYDKAREAGKDPQSYADEYARKFRGLKGKLGLSDDIHFVRTTDEHHKAAAQEFWGRCDNAGDIYKKYYKVRYCIGCEMAKTDSELDKGKCAIHPSYALEIRDEENYFFKFSKYQKYLLEFYEKTPDFVVPDYRFNEIKSFVGRGLEDFSISRLRSKMPWGVAVPGDTEHVMYVWFDALINYISTLGWPENIGQFEKFWGRKDVPNAVQFAGKDNLRQQSAMWQAMLMSAGLPTSRQIMIHGFITSGGQKMSKSIGNVVDPLAIVAEYGTDALRYYLARHIHPFEDSDFTMDKFKEAYNANLANGIGNLTARVMKLSEKRKIKNEKRQFKNQKLIEMAEARTVIFQEALEQYNVQQAADCVWDIIQAADRYITETKPWEGEKVEEIDDLVALLGKIADLLVPILPDTSMKIKTAVKANKMPEPLFGRK
jgi:methionyl-tRNA synthetase